MEVCIGTFFVLCSGRLQIQKQLKYGRESLIGWHSDLDSAKHKRYITCGINHR